MQGTFVSQRLSLNASSASEQGTATAAPMELCDGRTKITKLLLLGALCAVQNSRTGAGRCQLPGRVLQAASARSVWCEFAFLSFYPF